MQPQTDARQVCVIHTSSTTHCCTSCTSPQVANFFAERYGPQALTVALVGDVTPSEVQRLAEKYWGDWTGASSTGSTPTMPSAQTLVTAIAAGSTPSVRNVRGSDGSSRPADSDDSSGSSVSAPTGSAPRERFYRDTAPAGPLVMLGFPRPALLGPQGILTQVACDVLGGSRSTRLLGRAVLGRGSPVSGVNV